MTMIDAAKRAPRKMPTHSAVFRYWRGKGCIRPDKFTCMHCGYKAIGHNLERAHIVARCDGGPDEVENLVLVCHPCHVITDGWSKSEWELRAKGYRVIFYPWVADFPWLFEKTEEAHDKAR